MNSKPEPYTPAYWRALAEQVRLEAASMKNPDAKEEMEKVAQRYERLARYVEKASHLENSARRIGG